MSTINVKAKRAKRGEPPAWFTDCAARWEIIARDLEARGGILEDLPYVEWAVELGLPARSLHGILRRMEQMGVVAIDRGGNQGSAYGGRRPNKYRLLMTWAEWERHSPAIWLERIRAYDRERKRREMREGRARRTAAELAEARRLEREHALNLAAERIERALAIADAASEMGELVAESDVAGWV